MPSRYDGNMETVPREGGVSGALLTDLFKDLLISILRSRVVL